MGVGPEIREVRCSMRDDDMGSEERMGVGDVEEGMNRESIEGFI